MHLACWGNSAFAMPDQLTILLHRIFSSRSAFSPGGDDPAVLHLDRAVLCLGETQGVPKGIGHCMWFVERSQEPVSTRIDPLPNGWEIATDRDGPSSHSFEKAIRRTVMIRDRDTYLGSPEERKYLHRGTFPHHNDLAPQLVIIDTAPKSCIVSGVDEHYTHMGIQVARQERQRIKQSLVAHIRTTTSRIHDKTMVAGPDQIADSRCRGRIIISCAHEVNTTPTRQDRRWYGWPEPKGPSQVDVALTVGKQ
jgi:hypothetical protein